jgi:chemotaxis protein MotB
MSRRRRAAEPVSHDRWLVSYADFITLLFAFFVVLFSSSQVDKRKVGKISAAIQEAFHQLGIFQTANSRVPNLSGNGLPNVNLQLLEGGNGMEGHGKLAAPIDKSMSDLPPPKDTAALQKQLASALQPQLERKEVVLKATPEGLVISLKELGFFDSGSAALRPGSEATVRHIAEVLAGQSNNIRIEGHTDNVPIHNAQFASNWELSTARATEMIRLFITLYDLPATRLSAAGYAEYHPVADNDTTDGRAQNRRVDIVVLNPLAARQEATSSTPAAAPSGLPATGQRQ